MAFKNLIKLCLLSIHFCTVYQCFFYINNYAYKELIINIIYPRRTKTC
nr:MAG TPA: hypothetical protein [Caudoviricetes sp.]